MEDQLLVHLKVTDLKTIISQSVSEALVQKPSPEAEDVLLKRKDVAKLFSVSLVTITDWMRTGRLPFHRMNSRIFFKKAEVMEALQSTKIRRRTK